MSKIFLLLSFFACWSVKSQVLNAYAKVSSISGTTFTVTNVNESNHTFAVGNKIIIMQMQDDVIGSNTTDASTFGDLSTISSAGFYEIGIISSRLPATGTPTSITVSSALANTYHTGINAS